MGCLKLTYYQTYSNRKVLYSDCVLEPKSAQMWLSVDPMSDKYPSMSPYNYCANNPVILVDPDGRDVEWIPNGDGGWKAEKNDNFSTLMTDAGVSLSGALRLCGSGSVKEGSVVYPTSNDMESTQNSNSDQNVTKQQQEASQPQAPVLPTPTYNTYREPASGRADFSPFNVEDIIGIGMLFKGIVKYATKNSAETFFNGAKYSDKVAKQMSKADDLFHSFPKSVDGCATKFGKVSTKIGGDGNTYHFLKLKGGYGGQSGTFEYIKDMNGVINHRLFTK